MDMATLRTLNKVNTIEEWADMMGVDVPDDEEPAQNDTLLLRSGIPGTSSKWTILYKFTKWDILII